MECNCKNNCDGSSQDVPRIKHVQGNVLRLAIPLTLRTIEQDGGEMVSSDTDFIPSSEVPVRVVFSKGAVNVPIDATMKNGNIAYVEDKGTIPVGTYNITITCSDDSGNPYRFKQNTVLQVVDATAEAGITTPIEYEVRTWYLESAIYLALEGKGIEDIITESSDEAGGFNYVTILLTDGTSRTFSVMNGSGLPDTELDVNSLSPIANKAVSMKFAEIENKLTSIIGDVDYDSTEKSIRFWNKEKTEVLMALDARPLIKDGMVNNVYINNNMLVVTFNTDAGREAIGIPLSLIFNPNNYYDKTQVDGKVSQLSSLFANYYNKTQVDRMISEVMSQQTYIRMDSDSVPPVFFDISGNQMQHADVIALFNDPSKNVVLHCEFEYEDKVCPCNLSLASIEDEGQYKMYYFEGSRIASLGLSFVASLFNADGTLYVNSWDVVQGGGEEGFSGDYNDLINKPTIPTSLSQMSGDSTHRTVTDAEKTAWNNKQDALTFDEVPTEDSANPVKSGAVYAALEGKAPKPKNTVYVDQGYWNSHKASGTVFSADDTHYILAHDFYNVVEPLSGPSAVPVQVFGKRCVLSAQNGCRFGRVKIQFTDTYIAVGQQQIFKQIEYEHPSSYDTTSSFIVEDGTRIAGTFANGRILVEWWGAVGGRGVKGEDGTFENAATERQALHNAIAFNLALMCAGQSEVYAPAPMYMIGASIMDATIPMLRDDIAHNSDGQFDPDIFDNDKINSTITSYTKLYVEGDLVASNEFVGAKRRCPSDDTINGIEGVPITAETEIPAVVYIGGCLPRCFIKGAIVVPYSAQDKTIVVLSSNEALPANPVVGETYFKPVTDEVKVDENTKVNVSFYDVYDAYYHYTDDDSPEKEVALRKVGHYYTTSSNLTNYKSSGSAYGGSNLKMPGMYGASVSAIGGYVEIARIIKGDHRGGFWNTTQDGKLMSYRYRKEVMHMGQCTALGLRCVKASTINVGLIEGFNDGVAFDGTHSPDYDAVEFNRFEFGSIACNHAIHSINGNTGHACLVNMTKDTKYFLDGSRWFLGGFEPFGAGSDGRHSFCPTTSKSTYLLVEWSGSEHGGGFSNHWFEWNNAPLRWYTSIIDIAHAKDNQFIMHGNTSGDTGRIVMWVRSSNISSDNSKFQYADGEDASSAWFPIDTFAGVESISLRPYAYADLAAMDNPSNIWSTRNSYTYKKQQVGRLAPASPSYTEWACPFSASRSFINFRTGSYNNVVRGGRDHMLCYNSVLNDSKSGRNELRHCQSAQAMYVDGNYTVYNANHPVFDIVRYERQADPRDHHNDQNHLTEGGEGRIMFVPDENTLSCLQAVDAVADISASGLYIIKGLSEVSTSAGNYKNTRYQLFEKYSNASAVALGWISSIFLKLVEGGGSGGTVTETDPTVPTYVKAITQANIAAWNAKAERVVLNMTVSHDVPSFTTQDGTTFTEAEFRALAADDSKEIVILRNGMDYYINTYRDSENLLVFIGHTSGRMFNVFYIDLEDEELSYESHNIDVPFYLSDLSSDANHRTVTDAEKAAWNAKVDSNNLSTVATTGSYNDLDDKPTIPAAQVQSDWDATSGMGAILNKPTIPSKTSDLTNDSGFIDKALYYGTCATAAATMPKVCTVDTFPTTTDNGVTHAKDGTIIAVKFTNSDTNTTAAPELNVNGIGAKAIMYSNAIVTSTAKNTTVAGTAKMIAFYRYDSSLDDGNGAWEFLAKSVDSNSTYSQASLGQGYAVQSNSAAATAITASISSYALAAGGIVSIKFAYDVPANATLNISSKGAKAIYNQGAAIAAGVIKAGDTATFIYSTYYHLISIDRNDEVNLVVSATSQYDGNDTFIGYTLDKTIAQMMSALHADITVVVIVDEDIVCRVVRFYDDVGTERSILFQSNVFDDGSVVCFSVSDMYDNNEEIYIINRDVVLQTRTVNNKALSNDITLNASDVGAMPTTHPANAITSAKISDWDAKADKVTIVEVSDAGAVSQALDPNKFYKFTGALTSLSLTLVSGTGFVMYAGKFTTGSGWGSNGLTIPATVTEAANNDEIAASKTYEFSIMDNVIVIKEV